MDLETLRTLYNTAVEAGDQMEDGDTDGVYDALMDIAQALWFEIERLDGR